MKISISNGWTVYILSFSIWCPEKCTLSLVWFSWQEYFTYTGGNTLQPRLKVILLNVKPEIIKDIHVRERPKRHGNWMQPVFLVSILRESLWEQLALEWSLWVEWLCCNRVAFWICTLLLMLEDLWFRMSSLECLEETEPNVFSLLYRKVCKKTGNGIVCAQESLSGPWNKCA